MWTASQVFWDHAIYDFTKTMKVLVGVFCVWDPEEIEVGNTDNSYVVMTLKTISQFIASTPLWLAQLLSHNLLYRPLKALLLSTPLTFYLFLPKSEQKRVSNGYWLDSGSCLAPFGLKYYLKGIFWTLMGSEDMLVDVG